MAKCSIKSEVVDYVLVMDANEAAALYRILMKVGGDPDRTRRGLADNIRLALASTGLRDSGRDLDGDLLFTNIKGNINDF